MPRRSSNRLEREKSPYLLQHARNPVDWHPWGPDAFSEAKSADKPIFLSVGYSTCHWCHVMARESFESEEIAAILNEHFVPIKVDREERPDIDKVYMTYVQATTGGGGWPMSVWLTPDLKPFMGGTYFPPETRWGHPGFKSLLLRIAELWKTDRDRIAAAADDVTQKLRELAATGSDAASFPREALLTRCFRELRSSYEPRYGGFGSAPKFPRPAALGFMLRFHADAVRRKPVKTEAKEAKDMALFTLKKMAEGGMHDHVGGGFHRYSVDDEWHVPHFEKMLYDQAQLACSYTEAFQVTHDPFYSGIARDILDYVLGNMTGREGQFFSAEDADSPIPGNTGAHAEGAFYVWEEKEILEALGVESASVFSYVYGIEPEGNVRSDPHAEFRNKNVLIFRRSVEEAAERFGKTPDSIRSILAGAGKRLLESRSMRPHPHLDDKTITAWNGLMISAFARAAQVLDERRYLTAASMACLFIREHLVDRGSGRLLRRFRDGDASVNAYADDYSFLIQGLLDLYEASFDTDDLAQAIALQRQQDALFLDSENGGYFGTAATDPGVLFRMKEAYDGAEPSPNSVSASNLLRMYAMTDNPAFRDAADRTLAAFGGHMKRIPSSMPQMLSAFTASAGDPMRIVVAGRPDEPATRAMLRVIHSLFIPGRAIVLADGGEGQDRLSEIIPFIRSIRIDAGKATAYVCRSGTCQRPTSDLDELTEMLSGA